MSPNSYCNRVVPCSFMWVIQTTVIWNSWNFLKFSLKKMKLFILYTPNNFWTKDCQVCMNLFFYTEDNYFVSAHVMLVHYKAFWLLKILSSYVCVCLHSYTWLNCCGLVSWCLWTEERKVMLWLFWLFVSSRSVYMVT